MSAPDISIADIACKHLRLEELDSIRIKRFRCKDCNVLLYRKLTAYGDFHGTDVTPYTCNFTQMRDTSKGRRRIRICDNAAQFWDGSKAWCVGHIPAHRGAVDEAHRLACEAAADRRAQRYAEEHKAFSDELRGLIASSTGDAFGGLSKTVAEQPDAVGAFHLF